MLSVCGRVHIRVHLTSTLAGRLMIWSQPPPATPIQMTFHALVDIKEGLEICTCYYMEGIRKQRQEHLHANFGFFCTCATCSLSGTDLVLSDQRQHKIKDLDDQILMAAQAFSRFPLRSVINLVEERIRLMKEEGFPATKAKRTMVDAIQACQVHKDTKAAAKWAKKARKLAIISGGADSPEVRMHDHVISKGATSSPTQLADSLSKAGVGQDSSRS